MNPEASCPTSSTDHFTRAETLPSKAHLEAVPNPNVRAVALEAATKREQLREQPASEQHGTYTEAYSGE